MPTCSAYNCTYKHKNFRTSGKSIHIFPFSRPEILKKWILNVRRKDWYPSKRSILCSDHFEPDAFDRTGQIVRLKPDAVPTIFAFPPHLLKTSCRPIKYREYKTQKVHSKPVPEIRYQPVQEIRYQPVPEIRYQPISHRSYQQQVINDHSYSSTPEKLKEQMEKEIQRRKKKAEHKRNWKLRQKEKKKLEDSANSISKKSSSGVLSEQMLEDNATPMSKKGFSGVPFELLVTRTENNKSDFLPS